MIEGSSQDEERYDGIELADGRYLNHIGGRVRLHQGEDDVRICIEDPHGQHRDGLMRLAGSPRPTLAGFGRLPFNGFIENIITSYGAYPLKIYIRQIKDLVLHKRRGVAHTIKTAIHLPLTVASSIFGGFLPTWIAPDLGTSLQSTISSILPFLNQQTTFGFGVFLSVMICTGWGAKLTEKILDYTFNHILDTPDTVLHFTQKDIDKALENNDELVPQIQRDKLLYAMEFLKGERENRHGKVYDFERGGPDGYIRKIAGSLREGDYTPLLKFSMQIRDRKLVSLSSPNKPPNQMRDQERLTEMFFAEKVIEDFSDKLQRPQNM